MGPQPILVRSPWNDPYSLSQIIMYIYILLNAIVAIEHDVKSITLQAALNRDE